MPGCAYDIGVGGNGSVWVTGCDQINGGFGIYQWDNGWQKTTGGATNISVDKNGHPFVTNSSGFTFWVDTIHETPVHHSACNELGIPDVTLDNLPEIATKNAQLIAVCKQELQLKRLREKLNETLILL